MPFMKCFLYYVNEIPLCMQGERKRIARDIDAAHDRMKEANAKLTQLEELQDKQANLTECKTQSKLL